MKILDKLKEIKITEKQKTIILTSLITVMVVAIIISLYSIFSRIENEQVINEPIQPVENPVQVVVKKDPFEGNDRIFAVMIDNEGKAVERQTGVIDAEVVYEILVEGGETRLMAIFKNKLPDVVGPVRSARKYFAEYAREYNAAFVHIGGSPEYYNIYRLLNLDIIDGLKENGNEVFWKSNTDENDWQNSFTDSMRLKSSLDDNNYDDESTDTVFTYNKTDTDLENENKAENIVLKYSGNKNIKYVYNPENKIYLKYNGNTPIKDDLKDEQYSAKNIIIQFVTTNKVDSVGRLKMQNIGAGEGYFITNGRYEKITWKKPNDITMTQYKDEEGNEIHLNNGQTWIQVVPTHSTFEIN